jgi:hypothetical protein
MKLQDAIVGESGVFHHVALPQGVGIRTVIY